MNFRSAFLTAHPFTQLLMLVMIMFVSMIVVMGLSTFAAIPFVGDDVLSYFASEDGMATNANLMRYFQLMSHVGLFIIPAIAFSSVISARPVRYLRLERNPGFSLLVTGCLIMFAAVPVVAYLFELNHQVHFPGFLESAENWMRNMETTAEQMTRYFLKVEGWPGLLFNVLMIAIIPALGEEFIFRGIVQKLFAQWSRNHHVAVIVTAVLFSAMHLQFFSFLPRFALGILLGYMLVWSGNLWIPIAAHFVNNLAALLAFHYFERGIISFEMEDLATTTMAPAYALASVVAIIMLVFAFRRLAAR